MHAAARCFRSSPRKRKNISARSRRATRSCSRKIRSSNRDPTFLFFKGAANGLFAEGADRLSKGVNDQQALMIGIRCERGSHRFFKRYGERFEDSEGKQIFMEFADEEKQHLELLIREYKSLVKRKGRRPVKRRARAAAPDRCGDRSSSSYDCVRRRSSSRQSWWIWHGAPASGR